MREQCCKNCIWYSRAYYERQHDMQLQGDLIKNPDDGADCDLFESADGAH